MHGSHVYLFAGHTHATPQLLHPLGDKSPIESFLKKKPGGGMHHICLEVSKMIHFHSWGGGGGWGTRLVL